MKRIGAIAQLAFQKRSLTPFLGFLILDAALLLYGAQRPMYNWMSAADWLGADTLLFGPLLAGAAAWFIWRDQSLLGEVMSARSGRPLIARAAVAAKLLVGAIAAHTVISLVMYGWAWTTFDMPPPSEALWLYVEPVAGYSMYIGFGMVIGRLLRTAVASAIAACSAFMVPMINWDGLLPRLLWEHGGGTGIGEDLVPRPSVIGAQLLFGLSLATVAVVFSSRDLRKFTLVTNLMLVLSAALSLAFLSNTWDSRFQLSAKSSPQVCVNGPVVVCVSADKESSLGALQAVVSSLRSELEASGIFWRVSRVETRSPGWLQENIGRVADTTRVIFHEANLRGSSIDISGIMDQLLLPASCRATDSFLSVGATESALAVSSWWTFRVAQIPLERSGSEHVLALSALSEDARRQWLVNNTEAMQHCDPALLSELPK
ncbi:MAG: hypothetical protein RL441_697 [Actinomycetota bacterium]